MRSERSEPRRGAALVVMAALIPLCFAGWLLWQSFSGEQSPAGGSFPAAGSDGETSHQSGDPSGGTPGHRSAGRGGDGQAPGEPGQDGNGPGGDGAAGQREGDTDGQREDDHRPLAGKVVVLDPGHNVGNRRHVEEINRQVDAGTLRKECDTTGAATNDGYTEASFTMDLAQRTRALLRDQGATVRFTHDGDRPWGPCVDERARIGNTARADAAVSLHADGSAPDNRGFHVIVPASVREGEADTTRIAAPSRSLGEQLRKHFAEATSLPPADYVGKGTGITTRQDLGGLNLSTVPKVFIECGNMRNAKEAAKLRSPQWRQRAAEGIADGIAVFLTRGT